MRSSGCVKDVPSFTFELLNAGTVVIRLGCFFFSGNFSKFIHDVVAGGALDDKTNGGDDRGGRGGGGGEDDDDDVFIEFFLPSFGCCKPASANSNHVLPLALIFLGLLFFNPPTSSLGRDIFIFSSSLTAVAEDSFEQTKSSRVVGFIGVVLLGLSIGHVLISAMRCLTGTIGTPKDLQRKTKMI